MFVRKKNNRSGSTSVVVVDKSGGKIHYLKTIGVSSDETEIAALYRRDKKWMSDHNSGKDMFEESAREQEEKQTIERFLSNVENAFRVTKGKIELRPMFHFTPKRKATPGRKPLFAF